MEYDIIATYDTLQVYRTDDGLLGILRNNEPFEDPKWFEVTCFKGSDVVYCRRKGETKVFCTDTGQCVETSNAAWDKYEDEPIENDLIITCDGRRYGLQSADGREILPIIYDQIYKWPGCDVIYARIGAKIDYSDCNGLPILTKIRDIKGATDTDCPYYIGEPQTNIIQLMDSTEQPYGDDFCTCYGRHTGLSRRTCFEHFDFMESLSNVKHLGIECHDAFLAWDCYIYASFGAQSAPKSKNPIRSCMRRLKDMRVFVSSWEWFFVVLFPEDAEVDIEQTEAAVLAELDKQKAWVLEPTAVGIGRTDRIKDGAIVYVTRFFRDHWPFMEEPENPVKEP